ncbi:MAG: biotin--[acetyl-CoA-carboxylase] ligase [Acutalibacteraceae bacterium]
MQNEILEILKTADGYVSGQQLSERLGVSRTAVWKAINALRDKGYVIDSSTNKGYILLNPESVIREDDIAKHLCTKEFGRKIILLDTVDSTNTYAKTCGLNGEASGTAVIAREQTNGKGRLGRTWQSQKDCGVWMSLLIRPELSPMEVSSITPLTGLAVCKTLNRLFDLKCRIKWPNDVIVGKKKICGTLTEMTAEFDAVEHIIIGIGINCDNEGFPEEIADKATSVFIETGKKPNKSELAAEILNDLEKELSACNYRLNIFNIKEYRHLCATLGKEIRFTRGNRYISAVAVDVNPQGELVAMLSDGTTCTINSGEVTVQGIY